MTLTERIKAAIERHPDWDDRHISNNTRGATLSAVRIVRSGQPFDPGAASVARPDAGVVTLDAVRVRYDTAAAIRREIDKLRPGALITENEMQLRAAGKDAARFRRTRENNDELKANRVRLKLDPDDGEGTWYWGDSATVAAAMKLRDEL